MKILYLCNVNRDSKAAVGVFKKINSQIDILRKNNHVVHLAFYKTENVYSVIDSNNSVILSLELKGARGNQRTNQILSQLYRLLSDQRYSVIYSRYETYSVSLANFYKKASYSGCLVLLEIPTYPITQRITTIKTSLEQRRYKTAMHQLYNATINSLGIWSFKKGVTRIVNNNGFSKIWGIETLKIHNAADVSSLCQHTKTMKSGGDIHLVGVANIAKWHGYDRVIEGIKKYYLNGGKRKVFFHIIGTGLELERLKKLASSSLVKDYIVFHGTVVGDELDDLFNQYDLGVSVLATYRSGMKNICDSLKSKEYCARGIPFITGELEHFYDGKEFVLTIPDNDTPVNIYNVCDFADRIADNPQIKEAMLEFAKSYCGWDYSFRSVIDYLKGQE